ncbi:dUTP diphosphatase [Anaerococcus hydrogenalis]|uniref:dUTP diphosphatase n=1 Tax=Anaerococcus hydrogenalis TaxID=33029 RepID=A0A2N6UL88_9FIRM|nr:dUTP diphosphatase [Anaerococcus hydrogenalis]MDK7694545.1 dUTP diphosphatase [Anaerococcus hydrogenalis]MDK7696323.1 dUTP diphosphatase [Anaerococcus hydrogenalis]MDK7707572.1 dUTP diphosphatase [Anaerococcus hydrogenalis]PMC82585.1 dUTP diphosphatase [Anaerococcus hydrogenalis]
MTKKILKIKTNNNLPEYKTKYSAGMDIYSSNKNDIIIKPGEIAKIETGLHIEIPEGFFAAIYPRSSTGVKRQLMLANSTGIIDSDYRGEIKLFFYNFGNDIQTIKNGERLAQMVIQPYEKVQIEKVDELCESERGEGGIGSTGK